MIIGVPRERKTDEYRVGLIPASVDELVRRGHSVIVETGAGTAIGYPDAAYEAVGATIANTVEAVFEQAQLIIKVKEPEPAERALLTSRHALFTFLHLAPDEEQTGELLASGATCIAYETVTDAADRLPLLTPMSEVAGRLSVQAGAHCLEMNTGGSGVLLGGVPGVEPAQVTIVGGGTVGRNALAMAVGLGARVTVLDRSPDVLRQLDATYGGRITTLYSSQAALTETVAEADLVIGSVLIPGASAPKLITEEMIRRMKPGSVLVDVAIDQGGCAETSRPTTPADPTYVVDGVVHYCVANMPGAVARTSTRALNIATLPFVLALADKGTRTALKEDEHLRNGLNVCAGEVTHRAVAEAHGLSYVPPLDALSE